MWRKNNSENISVCLLRPYRLADINNAWQVNDTRHLTCGRIRWSNRKGKNMTTTTIIRGSEMDRKAYIWAVSDQGYTGTWADWQAMPLDEREEYESGAAGGGPTHAVVEQIKVCGGTATTTELTAAIARSRSHNEIVSVEIEAADISEVLAELAAIYDGEIDDARENDGTYGVWGWTDDMAEGEMDWRINVTLVSPPPKLVKVVYWAGATQREGLAADYAEAMDFASRNQNSHDPKFYEIATGEQLYDDGNGLRAESADQYVC